MRLTRFLNEEDAIKKGLGIDEPEIDEEYSKDEIKYNISTIKDAISAQEKKGIESKSDNAILKDLKDKLDKWENVESETKAAGPVVPAVDILAAQPPPAEDEAPPEKKEEDDPKGQKDAEDKAKKAKKK